MLAAFLILALAFVVFYIVNQNQGTTVSKEIIVSVNPYLDPDLYRYPYVVGTRPGIGPTPYRPGPGPHPRPHPRPRPH